VNLAIGYANGTGVPKDEIRSYAWFNLAAASNDSEAGNMRDRLEQRLTLSQKAEAQKLSAELFEKINKQQ